MCTENDNKWFVVKQNVNFYCRQLCCAYATCTYVYPSMVKFLNYSEPLIELYTLQFTIHRPINKQKKNFRICPAIPFVFGDRKLTSLSAVNSN